MSKVIKGGTAVTADRQCNANESLGGEQGTATVENPRGQGADEVVTRVALAATCALALVLPATLSAQTTVPGAALQGAGFVPCEQVLKWDERGVDLFFLESWFLGYWSGRNIGRVQAGEAAADLGGGAVASGALQQLIVARCREAPGELVFNVVGDFASELPRAEAGEE